MAWISTRIAGRAIGDSTVARAGLFSGSIHAFQTAFIALKSALMSLSHMVQCSRWLLSVPANASRSSIFFSTFCVC